MSNLDQQHPIITTNYVVRTQQISDLFDSLDEWLNNRCPGAIIYGMQRAGKSRGIRYQREALLSSRPKLFTFHFPCNTYRLPSEGAFFSDLLKAAGHMIWSTGSPTMKRYRLVEFLADKAISSGEGMIVLFADDAQRLREIQYNWLMDIHNELQLRNIHLIAILVGQEELLQQRDTFFKMKQKQLIGRFMVHERQFYGIRSLRELQQCLTAYDDTTEYPVGSGNSFTSHFFPEAWKRGWRLRKEAEMIWGAIRECAQEIGKARVGEIPMQYICRIVENILKYYGPLSSSTSNLTHLNFKDAVARSGLIDSFRFE